MHKCKTLYEFLIYCESVVDDNNDMWLLSSLIGGLTPNEFLNDCRKSFQHYFYWLKVAQDAEQYLMCATIHNALQLEIEHYNNLSKNLFDKQTHKDLSSVIKKIVVVLKDEYLFHEYRTK